MRHKGQEIKFYREQQSYVIQLWQWTFFISGTYYAAVIENRADFTGRVVVDVGAGSGILSLFAAQVDLALFNNKPFWLVMIFYFLASCLWMPFGAFIDWACIPFFPSLGWCKTCLCCGSIWNGRICSQTNCGEPITGPTNNCEIFSCHWTLSFSLLASYLIFSGTMS